MLLPPLLALLRDAQPPGSFGTARRLTRSTSRCVPSLHATSRHRMQRRSERRNKQAQRGSRKKKTKGQAVATCVALPAQCSFKVRRFGVQFIATFHYELQCICTLIKILSHNKNKKEQKECHRSCTQLSYTGHLMFKVHFVCDRYQGY